MQAKKILAGILFTAVLLSSTVAFAEPEDVKLISAEPIKAEHEESFHFMSFTGLITQVQDHWSLEGAQFVSVEDEKGNPANITISPDTYVVENADLEVGVELTCFYDATKPMILIYPPQYRAEVVVVGEDEHNLKADLFDENLVSADNRLKLNITEETEVVLRDGTAFTGDLAGKLLLVFYGASTKSIPAQTVPVKVVVLENEPEEAGDGNQYLLDLDFSAVKIVVEDEFIEAPQAYLQEDYVVMVPLRAVVEALGYGVGWDDESKSAELDGQSVLTIGEDKYGFGDETLQLGTAPELLEGRTFVPLNFFKQVLGLNNAYLFEGQINIDNQELMH